MASILPLAVSVGDPDGIGPEVSLRAALAFRGGPVELYGDASALRRLAAGLGPTAGGPLPRIVHVADWEGVARGIPTAAGGRAQLLALDAAADAVRGGRARALVTGPTSKAAITASGVPFAGQTEHLALRAGLAPDAVTMLFLGPRLRVGLATTHLALRDVPAAVTAPRLVRTARHLADACGRLGVAAPRIVLAGLNPHAGEGGLFGDEEEAAHATAVDALRAAPPFREGPATLVGVRPAEAAFRDAAAGRVDGVVAAYHDQATIASKLLDWGEAVNVTWGLPFVRTSVDHGVAYDLAPTPGRADPGGMAAALALADRLTPPVREAPS